MPRSIKQMVIATALAVSTLAVTSTASASDEVAVVVHGGTTGVIVLEFDATDGAVFDLGDRRVIPVELGPRILNDVKVLPDGTHLVAGGDDVGLMVTEPDGELIFELSRRNAFGAVAAASVGAYFSGAEPSRLLLGSDVVSAAFVRQVSSERLLSYESTRLGESRGEHAEVIVLPGNVLAVAANYPTARNSALDLIAINEEGTTETTRFAAREDLDHPPDTMVDPAFNDLRDVHGFGGDTPAELLVVTRRAAFRLAADGTMRWRVDPSEFGLGGEFASGVVLPSGNIALAIFEPGEWTEPHPNHRVVWVDSAGVPLDGAISSPLPAAPKSIEANRGHGGTGTTGFTAGLELLPLGDPADLELGPFFLSDTTVRQGERLTLSTSLVFNGANAVSLSRARIVAAPADGAPCSDVSIPVVDFARDESVTILAGESYPLNGSLTVDSVFDFGNWCAWVEIRDTAGRVSRLGDPAPFEVVEQGGDAGGEPVPSRPIGFGGTDAGDGDADAGGDAGVSDDTGDGGGCQCSSSDAGSVSGSALLLLMGLLLLRARRP